MSDLADGGGWPPPGAPRLVSLDEGPAVTPHADLTGEAAAV
jgi:hypothetical protein